LLEETLENRTKELGELYKKTNTLEAESEEKDKLIMYLEKMTQNQIEQIKEFDKDFSIVQTLKTDLDGYNDQLNKLVSELTSKTEECESLKQTKIELSVKLESFKKQVLQLEDQLATELDYKNM
jgi:septal ring factor EnvC (AmiA/AmiB activator)